MAPLSILKTDRLVLRRVVLDDAAAIGDFIGDPRIYRMVSGIPANQSLSQTQNWISRQNNGVEADTDHAFAIELDGKLTGMVSAHRKDQWAPFGIGYWIAPAAWNHGYATEAGRALLNWLESRGQFRAVSGYFVDNPGSGRVLSKLGFMKAGRDRQYSLGRGEYVEHLHMARISKSA